jgi:hypothetical protein
MGAAVLDCRSQQTGTQATAATGPGRTLKGGRWRRGRDGAPTKAAELGSEGRAGPGALGRSTVGQLDRGATSRRAARGATTLAARRCAEVALEASGLDDASRRTFAGRRVATALGDSFVKDFEA